MSKWFPPNLSTYGGDIDHVFWVIFYIVGFWFLLSEGAIFYFLFRYRKKKSSEGKATYVSGETWKQMSWILIPCAIILVLDLGIDFTGGHAYDKVKGDMPEGEVFLNITGKQFAWEVAYPGLDGEFGTEDDLLIENEIHVPVGKNVQVTLASKDVIHSFFVPVFRLKQDAVPGRQIPVWFQATATGEYEIACAELCGFGHHTMRGFIIIHTEEGYKAWLEKASSGEEEDEWTEEG